MIVRLLPDKKPVSGAVMRTLREFEPYFLTIVDRAAPAISGPSLTAIEAGGKRLRPALVVIASDLADSCDHQQLMRACSAVELVHLASLIHDDVLDRSETRRGVKTINADHSRNKAVIVGDYLFGLAFEVLAQGGDNSLMEPLAEASVALSSGELLQRQSLRQFDQSVEDYLERIYDKTAALFVASCKMGARLGRSDARVERALQKYASNLGTAFQIYDDILDFTGDESNLGKPVGNDVREGTVTLPMIYALRGAGSGILRAALLEPEPHAVEKAVESVCAGTAISEAESLAKQFVDNALEAVESLPEGRPKKDMVSLGNFVTDRYH